MKLGELLVFSFNNLWRRKLRTALTLLGVMIGTASIVVMMSLGIGLNSTYMQQIENSGTLTRITVNSYGGYMSDKGDSSTQLKLNKTAIAGFGELEHVVCASPVYNFTVIAKSGKYEAWLGVNAISYDMLIAMKVPVLEGEIPERGAPLTFLAGRSVGYNFYDPTARNDSYMMYGGGTDEPPVNLYDAPVFVIFDMEAYQKALGGEGVMPKKYLIKTSALLGIEGEQGWSDYDYQCYAELESVERQFTKLFKKNPWPGQTLDSKGKPIIPMEYNQAYVLVDEVDNVTAVQQIINDMGYQASSEMDFLKTMQEQSRTIQYVLAGIGSVSLIVAAIGITNTMLMSIFERTKEIGIFKVLGCSLGNIRSMFLIEAGLIGFSGGLLGLGLSFGLSAAINAMIGQISVIPFWLALLGLGFAVAVGMIAGISPALRAMKLSPLEAIRSL